MRAVFACHLPTLFNIGKGYLVVAKPRNVTSIVIRD